MFNYIKNKLYYLPILGIICYVILYTIADFMYAGGSEQFTFFGNLLCDMMGEKSVSGYENKGRFIAISGHIILAIGMITFFYLLPKIFSHRNFNVIFFQVVGMLSMTTFIFLSTSNHDLFVTITGTLGFMALIPLSIEYSKLDGLFQRGFSLLCIVMSLMVFISYETKIGIKYLPPFQKFVFACDTIWVLGVCLQVRSIYKLSLQTQKLISH